MWAQRLMRRTNFVICLLALALAPKLYAQQAGSPSTLEKSNQLRILTWNIWMMPGFTHQSPANKRRAAAIADVLLTQDVDILCLEKAFDGSARKVLAERLRGQFPYIYGPANQKFGLKINSGVWVLSRIPLSGYRQIEYHKAAGIEKFSRKGAIYLTGVVDGKTFVLIATHLQGEEGPVF